MTLWGTGLGALAAGSDADGPKAAPIRTDVKTSNAVAAMVN